MMGSQPLEDVRVVSLAINLPGPLAVSGLRELGATVTKIEPPSGDPLALFAPALYEFLGRGLDVRSVDLKTPSGKSQLESFLGEADLLLTSSRLAALARLGLAWADLHERHPQLVQVAIVGFAEPDQNEPGHDLTYQARYGLLNPPDMPRALVADIGGAQQAVISALGLLLARERGQGAGYEEVSLAEAANHFAQPLRHGLTSQDGVLGGAFAGYQLYETAKGWIAIAALEPAFWARMQSELQVSDPTHAKLQDVFRTRTASEWEAWAGQLDLPLVALCPPALAMPG